MNWIELTSIEQLEAIRTESKERPVVIFKHSTRCSISRTALDRLERNWKAEEVSDVNVYYLDLLTYRSVSNQISESFLIEHESPQLLLLRDGNVIYHRSHFEIDFLGVKNALKALLAKS